MLSYTVNSKNLVKKRLSNKKFKPFLVFPVNYISNTGAINCFLGSQETKKQPPKKDHREKKFKYSYLKCKIVKFFLRHKIRLFIL